MKKILIAATILVFGGCATSVNTVNATMKPEIKSKNAKLVADMTFKVPSGKVRKFYYRFAPKDSIVLNAWVVKGNDISLLSVSPYSGSEVMRFSRIPYVLNRVFVVDTGGIYEFAFKNTSSFKSKVYRFTLHRIPSSKDKIYFNTSVFWDTIYDTTYRWVVESTVVGFDTVVERVFFREIILGKNSMRCMKIDVPRNTEYVVYMVGIAEGTPLLPTATGKSGDNDPLGAFARGEKMIVPRKVRSTFGIDYAIDRSLYDCKSFLGGGSIKPERWAREVVLDYGRLRIHRDFYVCMKNNSSDKDLTVFTDIIAIKSVPLYDIRRVRRPFVKMYRVPK